MQIEVRHVVPNNTNDKLLGVGDQGSGFFFRTEDTAMSYVVALVIDFARQLAKLLDAAVLGLPVEHGQEQLVKFASKSVGPPKQLVHESGVKFAARREFLANRQVCG